MKRFDFKSGISLRGRQLRGLRGFAGKPFHPPLTDVPIGAYIIAPVLDAIAFFAREAEWAPTLQCRGIRVSGRSGRLAGNGSNWLCRLAVHGTGYPGEKDGQRSRHNDDRDDLAGAGRLGLPLRHICRGGNESSSAGSGYWHCGSGNDWWNHRRVNGLRAGLQRRGLPIPSCPLSQE